MTKLGIESGRLMPCPSKSNCVCSQSEDDKYFIEPLIVTGSSEEVRKQILKIINEEARSKIMTAESDYVRAEFSSQLFRFVDDVEFYFPATESEEVVVHVRSASRVGYSDFGVNRKRIEAIRKKLNEIGR